MKPSYTPTAYVHLPATLPRPLLTYFTPTFSATLSPRPFGALSPYVGSRLPCFTSTSSSFLSSRPRLRISPAEGAASRGVWASRRRYADWRTSVFAAYMVVRISIAGLLYQP